MVKRLKHKITNIELSKLVSLLGKILGIVVKEQEGKLLYNKIEQIRYLSKASRGAKSKQKIKLNETKQFRKLISSISKLSPSQSLIIARSFSKFLNFSNLAESLDNVHKVEEGKIQQARGNDEFTLLEDVIEKLLKKKKISKEKFYNLSKSLNIELVLTAHPTEVKRRTLIQKYTKVNDILEKFNKSRIFKIKNIEKENNILEKKLHEQITSIWKTDELKRSKPTPVQEAKWGLAVIEDSLWNTHQINNMNPGYDTLNICITYADAGGYFTCCVTWIWDSNLGVWAKMGSVTSIGEIDLFDKKLIKVVDVLGRETSINRNQMLFFIYEDGTIEKRYIIDRR